METWGEGRGTPCSGRGGGMTQDMGTWVGAGGGPGQADLDVRKRWLRTQGDPGGEGGGLGHGDPGGAGGGPGHGDPGGEGGGRDRGLTGQVHILPGCLLEPSTYAFDYQAVSRGVAGWATCPEPEPSCPQAQCVGAPPPLGWAACPLPSLWQRGPCNHPSVILVWVLWLPAPPPPCLASL